MIVVSVNQDIKDVLAKLSNFDSRQIPFVIAKALTNTAQDARASLRAEMPKAFDRPTPWTLNSLYVYPATKQRLEATVRLKDFAGKGTPASKYLAPSIFGGQRNIKRVERLMSARGLLPTGMAIAPGSGAELDGYGNVARGQYSRILSQLQAQNDSTQNETLASRKRKGKNKARYFVPRQGSKLAPAVYAREGRAIKPVLMFIGPPSYRRQYDFFGVIDLAIKGRFARRLEEAMRYALATSR